MGSFINSNTWPEDEIRISDSLSEAENRGCDLSDEITDRFETCGAPGVNLEALLKSGFCICSTPSKTVYCYPKTDLTLFLCFFVLF